LTPWFGEEVPERGVLENGRRFSIRPANGLSVGLYLDAREAREWVSQNALGKKVLNCFAYTCGFGIAATAGGALRAVNVDVSRKVLDWGEENARLNAQEVSRKDFIAGDVFDWLLRFSKKQERFDLVVLDPPSFSNTRQSRFSAAKDYGRLVAAALGGVAEGGRLLACCNLSTLDKASFRSLVFQAVRESGRTGKVEAEMGASSIDHPMPPGQGSPLKVVAVALK
jgi:23S rRNA (cytosine1962-C5)-methyltransferase